MRVLIVEDEPDLAELERICLSDRHDVDVMTDNFDRLTDPEHDWKLYDCVVCDLRLHPTAKHPQGEDIVAYLGTAHPDIRRVVVTGRPISEVAHIKRVADAVLLKPFDPRDLQAAVSGC